MSKSKNSGLHQYMALNLLNSSSLEQLAACDAIWPFQPTCGWVDPTCIKWPWSWWVFSSCMASIWSEAR